MVTRLKGHRPQVIDETYSTLLIIKQKQDYYYIVANFI